MSTFKRRAGIVISIPLFLLFVLAMNVCEFVMETLDELREGLKAVKEDW